MDNHPNWLIFCTRGWNHQPGYVMIHSWYVIISHHPSQAGMLPRFLSSKKVWPEHASDECCAHWESWHGKHKENACDKALHDSQCLWMSMVNDILRGWPCRSSRRLSHVVSLETFTILGWSGFSFQTKISTWQIHRALISTMMIFCSFGVPFGKLTVCYWKWPSSSRFTYWKQWFFPFFFVYLRGMGQNLRIERRTSELPRLPKLHPYPNLSDLSPHGLVHLNMLCAPKSTG